jgi:hypothetical protein
MSGVQRCGEGVLTLGDGTVYTGRFDRDWLQGHGTIASPLYKYEGNLVDGMPQASVVVLCLPRSAAFFFIPFPLSLLDPETCRLGCACRCDDVCVRCGSLAGQWRVCVSDDGQVRGRLEQGDAARARCHVVPGGRLLQGRRTCMSWLRAVTALFS